MTRSEKIYLKLLGKDMLEAFKLDALLKLCAKDGGVYASHPLMGRDDNARLIRKLMKDDLIELCQGRERYYRITSDGIMTLSNGGYKRKALMDRLGVVSFILSLFASIMSILAFFS